MLALCLWYVSVRGACVASRINIDDLSPFHFMHRKIASRLSCRPRCAFPSANRLLAAHRLRTRIVYSYWFVEKSMLQWKYSAWSLVPVLAFCSASVSRAQSNPVEVRSPDHRIVLRFSVQPGKGQAA